MSSVVVFDLDKVLLGGDASTLFLRGRLSQAPARLLPLLLASPVLLPGSAVPQSRPLAARLMTRIAVGGRSEDDVEAVAEAYRRALTRKPEAAVAEAIACLRRHRPTATSSWSRPGARRPWPAGSSPRSGWATSTSSAPPAGSGRRGCAGPWASRRWRC